MSRTGRWAYPLLYMTFDPWQVILGVCQEVKGEYTSVDCGAGGKASKV